MQLSTSSLPFDLIPPGASAAPAVAGTAVIASGSFSDALAAESGSVPTTDTPQFPATSPAAETVLFSAVAAESEDRASSAATEELDVIAEDAPPQREPSIVWLPFNASFAPSAPTRFRQSAVTAESEIGTGNAEADSPTISKSELPEATALTAEGDSRTRKNGVPFTGPLAATVNTAVLARPAIEPAGGNDQQVLVENSAREVGPTISQPGVASAALKKTTPGAAPVASPTEIRPPQPAAISAAAVEADPRALRLTNSPSLPANASAATSAPATAPAPVATPAPVPPAAVASAFASAQARETPPAAVSITASGEGEVRIEDARGSGVRRSDNVVTGLKGTTPAAAAKENFAAVSRKGAAEFAASNNDDVKKSLSVKVEPVTAHDTSFGINAAKPEHLMPAVASHASSSSAVIERLSSVLSHGVFESVTSPSGQTSELTEVARRAVTAAVAVTEQFASGDKHAVTLKFTVSGVELGVRVELRGENVHTTFRTDSPELRSALAHEWQSFSATSQTGDRPARLAEPVFTSQASGNSSSNSEFGSADQRGSQARQGQSTADERAALRNFSRSGSSAQPAVAAGIARPISRSTPGRLDTFA